MSRSPTSPRAFGSGTSRIASGSSGTNGSGNGSGAVGISRPSVATDTGGHRYTSLSSLMRSPDRDSRMEWSGSPSSVPTNMSLTSPRHAHFNNQQTTPTKARPSRPSRPLPAASSTAPPDDVPPWTIPGSGDRPPRTSVATQPKKREKAHLSWWRIIGLTVAMGGSQIVWTVELGYGTPYLLGLGLSEKYTALVWLAGPISGLVVQPLIGAISDSSTSRYRRRFWVVVSTALLVFSLIGLGFTEPMAKAFVDLIGAGQGDWDPKGKALVKQAAIVIAVFCFYTLDFALNGLQASLRNLVFDVTPADQLNSANAWNGRFNHIGNIVGFFMGFMDLNGIPIISFIGGDQFRKLSMLSLFILVVTVWITCFTIEETERESPLLGERGGTLRHMLNTIHEAILTLPKPVRRICMVQIMAFMGWFPFLFYTTLYVRYVMSYQLGYDADEDEATRAGSFALLIHAFVAYAAGTILPYLSERDSRLLPDDDEDEEEDEHARVRAMVQQWKDDVRHTGRPLRLPRMPFMLRNVWTAALLLFFFLMMSTFFIVNVWQATIMISLVGICWAVACWVPFEMIMAFLKELEDNQHQAQESPSSSAMPSRTRSLPSTQQNSPTRHYQSLNDERRPLLMRSYSTADLEGASVEYIGQGPVAGGTIMGIHNLAIVLPQFIIAIVASIIFRLADGDKGAASFDPPPPSPPGHGGAPGTEPAYHEKTGVAWVLRFGGLMALVGAAICRRVPPTKQEKIMRRRLAEMREEVEAETH